MGGHGREASLSRQDLPETAFEVSIFSNSTLQSAEDKEERGNGSEK